MPILYFIYYGENMKIIFILFFIAIGILASDNKLTIDNALSIAIKNSPSIKAIKKEIISKKLSGKADSLYPNPEIEVEIGDFLGTGANSGFSNHALSLNLSQEIVLGGKNNKLINLTDSEIKLIKLEIKKEKINLKYQIKKLFTQILILKEFQKLSLENQKISNEILQTVKNKQESGDLSYLDILKSKIEYKNSKIELIKEESEIKSLKKQIASLVGDKSLNFDEVEGKLESELNYSDKLISQKHIDLEIKKAIVEKTKKELVIAKADKVQNLSLALGVNRYQEAGDYSFTFAVSMPIPIWNSNKTKVKSVYSEIEKGKLDIKASKKEIKQGLLEHTENLKLAKKELDNLKDEILPLAQKSLDLAKEGYKEGEFKYLELLDAQKTFILIKRQYIEVLAKYNLLNLEIEYLLGN